MKGCLQWNLAYGREDFASSGTRTQDRYVSRLALNPLSYRGSRIYSEPKLLAMTAYEETAHKTGRTLGYFIFISISASGRRHDRKVHKCKHIRPK